MEGRRSWLRRPLSMESLLPPNYDSDNGRIKLGLPNIRPAWLLDESIKSLNSKFPMVPAPEGTIVLYTTPLGEKLWQQPKDKDFDLTDPLRPSCSYNYLHDEHLKYYFKSNDIRKRLEHEGFITDEGYVKCSLKEFNQYREWIRKLKLDELHRKQRQNKEQLEEARKERLENIALERDVELQEIMKKRREQRKKYNELRRKQMEKEQVRQKMLADIDAKRREQVMNLKQKIKDNVRTKREIERMKRRKSLKNNANKEHKIKLRLVKKADREVEKLMRKLDDKKKSHEVEREKKIEKQWFRRQSWSYEYHEKQRLAHEKEEEEFSRHVTERNIMVSRQRRHSQVCYEEIARANRIAFENQLQDAEEFMAKLNEKRTKELEKWKKHFEAMKKPSMSSIRRPSIMASSGATGKRRTRRRSTWDLESCLLKDLGMSGEDVDKYAYSKLGVISHEQEIMEEPEFLSNDAHLGTLKEIKEPEGEEQKMEAEKVTAKKFEIPMIIESIASIREISDTESETTSSEVSEEETIETFFPPSRSSLHNINVSSDQLRHVISKYVESIVQRSCKAAGIEIKLPDRSEEAMKQFREQRSYEPPTMTGTEEICDPLPQENEELHRKISEYVQNIIYRSSQIVGVRIKMPDRTKPSSSMKASDSTIKKVKHFPLTLKSKRTQVREYLSNMLDNVEKKTGMVIKRPSEYEDIRSELNQQHGILLTESPHQQEDSEERKRAVQQFLVDVLQSAAAKLQLQVKLPDKYNEFIRKEQNIIREDESCKPKAVNPVTHGNEILKYEDELERQQRERLREENIVMKATQVTLESVTEALRTVEAEKINEHFFMSSSQDDQTTPASTRRSVTGEVTARLKKKEIEMKEQVKEEGKEEEEGIIPRESDFMKRLSKVCPDALLTFAEGIASIANRVIKKNSQINVNEMIIVEDSFESIDNTVVEKPVKEKSVFKSSKKKPKAHVNKQQSVKQDKNQTEHTDHENQQRNGEKYSENDQQPTTTIQTMIADDSVTSQDTITKDVAQDVSGKVESEDQQQKQRGENYQHEAPSKMVVEEPMIEGDDNQCYGDDDVVQHGGQDSDKNDNVQNNETQLSDADKDEDTGETIEESRSTDDDKAISIETRKSSSRTTNICDKDPDTKQKSNAEHEEIMDHEETVKSTKEEDMKRVMEQDKQEDGDETAKRQDDDNERNENVEPTTKEGSSNEDTNKKQSSNEEIQKEETMEEDVKNGQSCERTLGKLSEQLNDTVLTAQSKEMILSGEDAGIEDENNTTPQEENCQDTKQASSRIEEGSEIVEDRVLEDNEAGISNKVESQAIEPVTTLTERDVSTENKELGSEKTTQESLKREAEKEVLASVQETSCVTKDDGEADQSTPGTQLETMTNDISEVETTSCVEEVITAAKPDLIVKTAERSNENDVLEDTEQPTVKQPDNEAPASKDGDQLTRNNVNTMQETTPSPATDIGIPSDEEIPASKNGDDNIILNDKKVIQLPNETQESLTNQLSDIIPTPADDSPSKTLPSGDEPTNTAPLKDELSETSTSVVPSKNISPRNEPSKTILSTDKTPSKIVSSSEVATKISTSVVSTPSRHEPAHVALYDKEPSKSPSKIVPKGDKPFETPPKSDKPSETPPKSDAPSKTPSKVVTRSGEQSKKTEPAHNVLSDTKTTIKDTLSDTKTTLNDAPSDIIPTLNDVPSDIIPTLNDVPSDIIPTLNDSQPDIIPTDDGQPDTNDGPLATSVPTNTTSSTTADKIPGSRTKESKREDERSDMKKPKAVKEKVVTKPTRSVRNPTDRRKEYTTRTKVKERDEEQIDKKEKPKTEESSKGKEKVTKASTSAVVLRKIKNREDKEQSEISPQSSYVVLPQLTSSESTFITDQMEYLENGYKLGELVTTYRKPQSSKRYSIGNTVLARDAVLSDEVKLPHVSSSDTSQSPTPPRSISRSSVVSLPHIGDSNTSLVGGDTLFLSSNKQDAGSRSKTSTAGKGSKASGMKSNKDEEDQSNETSKRVVQTSQGSRLYGAEKGNKRQDSKYSSSAMLSSKQRSSIIGDKSREALSKVATNKRMSISKSTSVATVPERRTSQNGGSLKKTAGSKSGTTVVSDGTRGKRSSQDETTTTGKSTKDTKIISDQSKSPLVNTGNKYLPSDGHQTSDITGQSELDASGGTTDKSGDKASGSGDLKKKSVKDGGKQSESGKKGKKDKQKTGKNFKGKQQNTEIKKQSSLENKDPTSEGTKIITMNENVILNSERKDGLKGPMQAVGLRVTMQTTPAASKSLIIDKHVSRKKSVAKRPSEVIRKRSVNVAARSFKPSYTQITTTTAATAAAKKTAAKQSSSSSKVTTAKTTSEDSMVTGVGAKKTTSRQRSSTTTTTTTTGHGTARRTSRTQSQRGVSKDDMTSGDHYGDMLQKTDSDAEVVVNIYTPDHAGEQDQTKESSKETGKTTALKSGVDRRSDEDKKQHILSVSGKTVEGKTKEELKRSSSKKAFGDNPKEKNLINIIPRNSLDILKVTKISNLPSDTSLQTKGSRIMQSSRLHSRKSSLEDQTKPSKSGLLAEGFGVSGKQAQSMTRISSKIMSNLEKVEERPESTESSKKEATVDDKNDNTATTTATATTATAATTLPSQTSPEMMAELVGLVGIPLRVTPPNTQESKKSSQSSVQTQQGSPDSLVPDIGAVVGIPLRVAPSSNQKLESGGASPRDTNMAELLAKSSRNVNINAASFTDVVQGTPLFKDNEPPSTKPGHSNSSLDSQSINFSPVPPSGAKPSVVSPKMSRIRQNLSNISSKRSHGSQDLNIMSPTASLEIVKLSSQASHGWVSSPTSSVKFLPPIETRASKISNKSDDSQKTRPRSAGSSGSRTTSNGSRAATIVELRRSSSGVLRTVDGQTMAVQPSNNGDQSKPAVVGF